MPIIAAVNHTASCTTVLTYTPWVIFSHFSFSVSSASISSPHLQNRNLQLTAVKMRGLHNTWKNYSTLPVDLVTQRFHIEKMLCTSAKQCCHTNSRLLTVDSQSDHLSMLPLEDRGVQETLDWA